MGWPQLLWEALGTVRALGALVRLITPVYAWKEEEAADRRRLAFTKETVPVLNEFLQKWKQMVPLVPLVSLVSLV